jgi:site-specific DNA-methyltransferase (cytosine-N4-specific)
MASEALHAISRGSSNDELVGALHSTDWNFHDSTTENDAHNIHPFPAKFIGQIPRKILTLFPVAPGTAVLDPFCGSGTTLLEAQNVGCDFVGVDLNPIAVLISKVKTDGLQPDALEVAGSAARIAHSQYRSGDFVIPDIPRLAHWFQPEVSASIACITETICRIECSEPVRRFLRLSLSAIIVRISNQESETRYAAIDKAIRVADVFRMFEQSGQSIAMKLRKSSPGLFSPAKGKGVVINADARDICGLNIPPISLVITSPPYPNAFEYWLYNKYRMYWLGFDPLPVRKQEIGARPHYVSSKGDTVHDFSAQMADAFKAISKHLVRGAHVAVVISSDCKIRGEVYDVPGVLEESLIQTGYEAVARVLRTIPRIRKAFNPKIGSIESETLLFMRWQGN